MWPSCLSSLHHCMLSSLQWHELELHTDCFEHWDPIQDDSSAE